MQLLTTSRAQSERGAVVSLWLLKSDHSTADREIYCNRILCWPGSLQSHPVCNHHNAAVSLSSGQEGFFRSRHLESCALSSPSEISTRGPKMGAGVFTSSGSINGMASATCFPSRLLSLRYLHKDYNNPLFWIATLGQSTCQRRRDVLHEPILPADTALEKGFLLNFS